MSNIEVSVLGMLNIDHLSSARKSFPTLDQLAQRYHQLYNKQL